MRDGLTDLLVAFGVAYGVSVILFIAASLDGYIAGPDDDLSWMFTDADFGFSDFYSDVDTLIMGRGTYEVVRSYLDWPYPGKRVIVVSRNPDNEADTPLTEIYSDDLADLLTRLDGEGAKKIWLVGGGELVQSFLKRDLLDEITVSMHPILLGNGVSLFLGGFPRTMLMLKDMKSYEGGLVQLNYHVMPAEDDEADE